jgi:hypothetical protein
MQRAGPRHVVLRRIRRVLNGKSDMGYGLLLVDVLMSLVEGRWVLEKLYMF